MDQDFTRPIAENTTVVYRCPCGNQLTLSVDQGGICEQCSRSVSAKSLALDLSCTFSLEDPEFDLDRTQPNLRSPIPSSPKVVLDEGSENEAELLIGKKFGHFEIIAPLGRGGMGQVYRALDTSLQRYVAVKVLRSGIGSGDDRLTSSTSEIDKLLQEAVSQARVPHPNIVTIYYVGKEEGNPFLAMELVNGETLNEKIKSNSLTFKETAYIGLQIAEALRASYELDIIHGDIKPSNVLISRDGVAKLSDFGMARSASDDRGVAEGGTPNYLAPELLDGVAISVQSDIYALGVTLYEMTFGELPFTMYGNQVQDWRETHANSKLEFPAPWPQHVPELWRAVMEKMLAKNPEDRYKNYDALLVDLKRMQTHSNVAARFFPRLIAAGVDWATVLLLTIGFQTAVILARQEVNVSDDMRWWMTVGVAGLTFIPILGYTAAVYYWRQTIGRSLMHLKVVNQYGLRPTGRKMAIRSLFRMQFPWIVIFFSLLVNTPFMMVAYIAYILSLLFLLADLVYMLLAYNGGSLHDLVMRTYVVLDTDQD